MLLGYGIVLFFFQRIGYVTVDPTINMNFATSIANMMTWAIGMACCGLKPMQSPIFPTGHNSWTH